MKEEFLIKKGARSCDVRENPSCLVLFLVLLITALIFSGSLKLEWTNWDDDLYVYRNPVVVGGKIKDIFTTYGDYNMYVPLVIASFALEWRVVKDKPFLYHFDNLLLHLFCTALVLMLFRRLGLSVWWSGFAVLLFGIHPLRVETVAWITERKELLCAFFYLTAMLSYIRYIESQKRGYLLFTFIFMILSLFSKTEALTLPVALVLLDWYFQRKIDLKVIFEKVVFFAVILAMTVPQYFFFVRTKNYATVDSKAISNAFDFLEQAILGGYVYAVYLLKSIFPYATSAMYPIPSSLQAMHWVGAAAAIIVFIGALAAWRKYRFVMFGLLFFTFNICFLILVSFFLSDYAFLNDHYTYIAQIGLFFVMGMGLQSILEKFPPSRVLTIGFAVVLIVAMSVLTVRYIPTWKNSETLWTYVIEKYPNQIARAHLNRGNYWFENGQGEKALRDFDAAIKIHPGYVVAYIQRSFLYMQRGEWEKALQDYHRSMTILSALRSGNKAIDLHLSNVYALRALAYRKMGRDKQALDDFNTAVRLDPLNSDHYHRRALMYMDLRQYENAIRDFNRCHASEPANADILNNRGVCYLRAGNFRRAVDDFNQAIELNRSNPVYFQNRATVYYRLKRFSDARQDAQTAEQMDLH